VVSHGRPHKPPSRCTGGIDCLPFTPSTTTAASAPTTTPTPAQRNTPTPSPSSRGSSTPAKTSNPYGEYPCTSDWPI
jgi:hypothetical protein